MRHMLMGWVLVGLFACGSDYDPDEPIEASDYCAEVASTMCEDIAVDCFGEYDATRCSTFTVASQCCQVWSCENDTVLTRGELDACTDDLHAISCSEFGAVPSTCY